MKERLNRKNFQERKSKKRKSKKEGLGRDAGTRKCKRGNLEKKF